MIRYAAMLLLLALSVVAADRPRPSAAAAPSSNAASNQTMHVFGFRVPQYDDQGRLTSMLQGREANVYPDRIAEISDVLVEIFRANATGRVVEARITSPKCFYQADKNIAIGEGQIRMAHEQMIVTGTNYVIDAKAQRLQINEAAKVVLMGVQGRSLEELMGMQTNDAPKRPGTKDGKKKP